MIYLFKNICNYNIKALENITVGNRQYKTEASSVIPDIIFALSYGLNQGPDSVNQGLAQSILDIRTFFDAQIPAIVQDRITPCLVTLNALDCFSVGKDSLYDWRLDSKDIFRLSLEKAKEVGLPTARIAFVAHPSHMQRVMDVGAKLGLNGSPFVLKDVQWSKNDAEKWVRSPYLWVPREIIARIIYRFKG